MGELTRVQVILDKTQRKSIARIAKREKRSMSAVVRDLVASGLAERAKGEEQWRAALADLAEIRKKQRRVYKGNLVAEARAERERQLDAVWQSSL